MGSCLKDKIKIYVCSLKGISPLDYVDKESIGHPCVTSRNRNDVFSGYRHYPGSGDGYLPENQRGIVDSVVEFCQLNHLDYKIVDVSNLSLIKKVKLVLKGIKAPAVTFKGKKIEGMPTENNLKSFFFNEN